MNSSSTITEQPIGKFHSFSLEKQTNPTLVNSDENSTVPNNVNVDETNGTSRFQMIRVDRNFGRGRWKVNDFEPAETNSTSGQNSVPTVDIDVNHSNNTLTIIPNDQNNTIATNLTVNVAQPVATTFAQQRLSINNTPLVLPHGNLPSTAGLLHPYPAGPLTNLPGSNQSFLLANHPQFGYYPFYPAPYPAAFAAQWAALAAANPYISTGAPIVSPIPTQPTKTSSNVPDSLRSNENEINSETSTGDHLPSAALATTPFLYAPRHSHSPYVPQHVVSNASPYATIPSYHPVAPLPTIIPPSQQNKHFSNNPLNSSDLITSTQNTSQQAPLIGSPKKETVQNLIQHPALILTPKPKPSSTNNGNITDLITTSPSLMNPQQAPISLLSPTPTSNKKNTDQTTDVLPDIWTYTNSGSPLNLSKTATVTGINLLTDENSRKNEITNEILKELTTPTKPNTTTDIDNKISAAMDLVKMHLLSAVREEVTELRQQIEILKEKLNSLEHENSFLRHHVSTEIYAQYIPIMSNHLLNSDSIHASQVASSQTITNNNNTSLSSAAPIQGTTLPSTA